LHKGALDRVAGPFPAMAIAAETPVASSSVIKYPYTTT
jgi:hypothetical protein